MKKNYFYIALVCFFLFTGFAFSQDGKQATAIDGLALYPNPVSSGRVIITSKSGADKDISIFDVLGKLVLQTPLSSKELNIGSLSPGIYIIKIRENEATATRKLIVR
ncbi:MAG: T9SS type A sorting domain-containing protein [Flavobacterium sp.]|nr:T9SS type A sorting domain-containing protein [Flavobacterium sp.]